MTLVIVWLVATLMGFVFGRMSKHTKLPAAKPNKELPSFPKHMVCGCTHNLSSHEYGGEGRCRAATQSGNTCACQFFTSSNDYDPEIEEAERQMKLAKIQLQTLELQEKGAGIGGHSSTN